MAITQLSLLLNNQPGQVGRAIGIIAETGANLRALSIAEGSDFGILRIIVSDSDQVCRALEDRFLISRTRVVAARMDDRSGALVPILTAMGEAGINIEYLYAFTASQGGQAYVVLRVNDADLAEKALNARGIATLTDDQLNL